MSKNEDKNEIHIVKIPFGSALLHYKNKKLFKVELTSKVPASRAESSSTIEDKAIEKYFDGDIEVLQNFPIALEGTDFRKKVWAEVQKIPYGDTKTYGEIADRLGTSPRAVGQAISHNPLPIFIPTHRVRGEGHRYSLCPPKEGIKFQELLLNFERKIRDKKKS